MAIKFRNRYLICSLRLKDPSSGLLASTTRQTILAAIIDSLRCLCGDVYVGRVKASLTIKDLQVVHGASAAADGSYLLFLMRVDRACMREVWLAATCVTEVDMRVARISVEDVSGGMERVKERYVERLERAGVAVDGDEFRRRIEGLEP